MSDAKVDQHEWYERTAERTGGYRKTWNSTILGRSGEDAFEELLMSRIEPHMRVLDAGCGSGEFAIRVASKVEQVTGIDFAVNMVRAATETARAANCSNVRFLHATTRDLPFSARSFDLVYSRRGPTSILLQTRLLRPGAWMLGVHSDKPKLVRERLESSGLEDVSVEEFETLEVLPTLKDLADFWSSMPGHPDYSDPAYGGELARMERIYRHGHEYAVPQRRFVWRGRQPRLP